MRTSYTTERTKIIMPLSDGGILSVDYDEFSHGGCETCDFGSEYIDEFTIDLTTIEIKVHINMMYEHFISEGWLMRQLLSADHGMTEMEFADWLLSIFVKRFKTEYHSSNECYGKYDPNFFSVKNKQTRRIERKEWSAKE